ncbi:hypothetical protein NDU88_006470 [Pleurodeles waltl]|uniref:Uncharacterized protein n=1 Tax=Pleurodeles waltl TaxID=8319 RepID=A0AAV7SPK1_PLEWA|nr:hypothetical protein NDU88_006470 [Pleurodeles waltl]
MPSVRPRRWLLGAAAREKRLPRGLPESGLSPGKARVHGSRAYCAGGAIVIAFGSDGGRFRVGGGFSLKGPFLRFHSAAVAGSRPLVLRLAAHSRPAPCIFATGSCTPCAASRTRWRKRGPRELCLCCVSKLASGLPYLLPAEGD